VSVRAVEHIGEDADRQIGERANRPIVDRRLGGRYIGVSSCATSWLVDARPSPTLAAYRRLPARDKTLEGAFKPLATPSKSFRSPSKVLEGAFKPLATPSKTLEGASKPLATPSKSFRSPSRTLEGASKPLATPSKTLEGASKPLATGDDAIVDVEATQCVAS
jgi:hypothetical protein